MAEADVLFTAGVLFVTFLVALIVLMLALHRARSKIKRPSGDLGEDSEPVSDRAYNVLVTTEAISREMVGKGFENVKAENLLRTARQSYLEGRLREAEEFSMEARNLLNEMRVVDTPPEPTPFVDGDEIPESKPILGKEYPRNFLQAKFFLGVVKDSLKKTRKRSGEVKRAREVFKEAEEAFEEERYNDALSLAVNSKRLLRGEEIPEKALPPEVIEGDHLCPECGSIISPDDAFCGKCGYRLVRSECPECGSEVGEGDRFCRRCGVGLKARRDKKLRAS